MSGQAKYDKMYYILNTNVMQNKNDSVLQVRINSKLKDKGEKRAEDAGFGSLQDAVRWFIKNFAENRVDVGINEPVEYLSDEEFDSLEKDYQEYLKDEKEGKVFTAHSVKELMDHLDSLQ